MVYLRKILAVKKLIYDVNFFYRQKIRKNRGIIYYQQFKKYVPKNTRFYYMNFLKGYKLTDVQYVNEDYNVLLKLIYENIKNYQIILILQIYKNYIWTIIKYKNYQIILILQI